MKSRRGWDWVDSVSKLAGALGFNAVKVRWKLTRWRDSTKNSVQGSLDTAKHVGYEHRMCPECGRLQSSSEKKCLNCGHTFAPKAFEFLNRIGLVVPHLASFSTLLALAMAGCYIRTSSASGGFFDVDATTLVLFGGSFSPSILVFGEWWRLATCIFLHGGILHLGFNLFALAEIGPEIETIFGRARFLFLFMVTGLVASIFSLIWRHYLAGTEGVSIGASGAIMGLVGVAAGWGQRDGTTIGRSVRDMMLKWGAYTVVFGFFIGADNAAHIAGFVSGGVIGFLSQPKNRRTHSTLNWMLAIASGALIATCVAIILIGPKGNLPF